MNGERLKQREVLTERERLEIEENINELKQKSREDEIVGTLLLEVEEERSSKKKLKEVKELLSAAQKNVQKAEGLLKEVINEREKENRAIEDAILLSDGIRKVREQEIEKETGQEIEKETDEEAEIEVEKETEKEMEG